MSLLKDLWEGFVHIIFPATCLGCSTEEPRKGGMLCISCLYHLPYTNQFGVKDNAFSRHFSGRVPIIHGAALFIYSEIIEQLVHRFKYKDMTKIGYKFGAEIGNKIMKAELFQPLDLIVPVPLHSSKLRSRGYNQSEVLSNAISVVIGLPVDITLLKRIKKTKTQTSQNRSDRIENLRDAFMINAKSKVDRQSHILLVDDVLTTGATLEACALVLGDAGYSRVSMVTLAMGQS